MTELKKQHKRKKALKTSIALGLFLILAAGGLFYLLVRTPYFQFKEIVISGTKAVSQKQIIYLVEQELGKKIYGYLSVNNPVFVPSQKIQEKIIDSFPRLKSVSVRSRVISRSLIVNVEERQAAVIWCWALDTENPVMNATSSVVGVTVDAIKAGIQNNEIRAENCFFADNEGFVFQEAPILSGAALLPTVYSQIDQEIKIRDRVTDKKMLDFIILIKKELMSANLNLSEFLIRSQSFGDLEIIVSEGWVIYMDSGQSAAAQVQVLKRVLEEKIKNQREWLEYVDLRVQNRAYYKLKPH